jgi:hypothetical protein
LSAGRLHVAFKELKKRAFSTLNKKETRKEKRE